MKTIRMEQLLPYPVEKVWEIFSDVTRSDWVPSVESITEEDGVRSFTMEGIGEIQERILKLDHEEHLLQYSAIKTPSELEYHLATIKLTALGTHCQFSWITEIAPDEFASAIQHGMDMSLAGLKEVLHEA